MLTNLNLRNSWSVCHLWMNLVEQHRGKIIYCN